MLLSDIHILIILCFYCRIVLKHFQYFEILAQSLPTWQTQHQHCQLMQHSHAGENDYQFGFLFPKCQLGHEVHCNEICKFCFDEVLQCVLKSRTRTSLQSSIGACPKPGNWPSTLYSAAECHVLLARQKSKYLCIFGTQPGIHIYSLNQRGQKRYHCIVLLVTGTNSQEINLNRGTHVL